MSLSPDRVGTTSRSTKVLSASAAGIALAITFLASRGDPTQPSPEQQALVATPSLLPAEKPVVLASPTLAPRPTVGPDLGPVPNLDVPPLTPNGAFAALIPEYNSFLNARPLPKTPLEAQVLSRDIVFRQAEFYNKQPSLNPIDIVDNSSLGINGRVYDLRNYTDLAIGSALVEAHVRSMFPDEVFLRQLLPVPPSEAIARIEKLNDKLTFLPSMYPREQARELAIFQPILELLEQSGKPIPTKFERGVGRNEEGYDKQSGVLKYNDLSRLSALGSFYKQEDPTFFEKFRLAVEPYSGKDGNIDQYFGGTLDSYLQRGAGFRARILFARERGMQAEETLLVAEYQAAKQWLGAETSIYGQKTEVRSFSVGETAQVHDFNRWPKDGILLKDKLDPDIDPNQPAVFDGDKVKVLSTEAPLSRSFYSQADPMVLVEVSGDSSKRGYISREFLQSQKTN